MKNASASVRLLVSLFTIGALFFGIAAVALNFGGDGEITAEDGAATTSTSTTSPSPSHSESSLDESPKPDLDSIGAPAIDPTLDIPTTTVVKPTTSTTPKSTPSTDSQPKPTSTNPTTTNPPPPPSEGIPSDAVVVNPGDDLQTMVNRNPEGTSFYLRAGVHQAPGGTRHVDPRSGNTFIGESGAVMDGGGSTTYAFQDNMKGANVTIRGIEIRNYNNPAQRGAIDAISNGWRVIANDIHHNRGAGIQLAGNNWIIDRNHVHHNDQIGIKGFGSGNKVTNNTISSNNPNRNYDWAWEAGGTKFLKTTNLYVAGNKVLSNNGPGLWTDHDNRGTVYEGNTVRDNAGPGIFHEISYSAVIRNNTVTGNAHPFYLGGILVANSSDVTVSGNNLSGNDGGIVGLQDSRGGYNTVNLTVTGNNVSHSDGVSGLVYNSGNDVAASGTIRFDQNTYSVGGDRPFAWKGGSRTIAEWQALGQDVNSTFN